jgi:hypothetical protein
MTKLSKRGLLDGCNSNILDFCEHCVFGKHKRVKFSPAIHNTENILDYVHSDLWGGLLVKFLIVVLITC